MFAIRVENLRCLEDTGFIEIKPITLLLGKNSSGKSSFLRLFPLLRQSFESAARIEGPILWYGNLVDFGSFREALNKNKNNQEIVLHFRFHLSSSKALPLGFLPPRFLLRGYELKVLEDLEITLKVVIVENEKSGILYTKDLSLTFAGHTVDVSVDYEGKVTKFFVNSHEIPSNSLHVIQQQKLIPEISDDKEMRKETFLYFRLNPRNLIFLYDLCSRIKKQAHYKTKDNTILSLAMSFGIGSTDAMLRDMQSNSDLETWKKKSSTWTLDNEDFKIIRDLSLAFRSDVLFSLCDGYISYLARRSSYIAPLRATAERYYRIRNLTLDEVDFQGQNLSMLLLNLSIIDKRRFSDFCKWTEKHFGFTIVVKGEGEGEQVSLRIKEGGSRDFNLVDSGFGFSQVLPILTQLWLLSSKAKSGRFKTSDMSFAIFAIEQPELHLHPALQAKLADAFLAAIEAAKEIGINLCLIIETHSETIVNRFGHRIAKRDLNHKDINVVLFDKERADVSAEVRVVGYDEDGFLEDWPIGFLSPGRI